MSVYRGLCHCGAVGFEFRTERAPSNWFVRTCQCSFCRKHAGLYTSDPAGSLRFTHQEPAQLSRYRFGHQTADFLFCGRCGGYLGAVTEEGGRMLMVINLRALDSLPEGMAEPQTMTYEDETAELRISRHSERWTPVSD